MTGEQLLAKLCDLVVSTPWPDQCPDTVEVGDGPADPVYVHRPSRRKHRCLLLGGQTGVFSDSRECLTQRAHLAV